MADKTIHDGRAARRRLVGVAAVVASTVAAGCLASTATAAPPASATTAAAPVTGAWVGGAAARRGTRANVTGHVASASGSVRVDRLVGGRWAPVTSVPVTSRGTWSAGFVVPSVASSQSYRAVWLRGGAAAGTAALPTLDVYSLDTYTVQTRGRVTTDVAGFAAFAAATYADPRGWRRAHHRFARVTSGGDFTLVLAQAEYLPRFSPVCSVKYSCRAGRYVIVNDTPWRKKTPYFPGDLTAYRRMVVNHETGHWLGLGHQYCTVKGALASVMQQQSKGMQGCLVNSWPLPAEIARVH